MNQKENRDRTGGCGKGHNDSLWRMVWMSLRVVVIP